MQLSNRYTTTRAIPSSESHCSCVAFGIIILQLLFLLGGAASAAVTRTSATAATTTTLRNLLAFVGDGSSSRYSILVSSFLKQRKHHQPQRSTAAAAAVHLFWNNNNQQHKHHHFQQQQQQQRRSIITTMGAKMESPSAERNKEPIWNVLQSKIIAPCLKQQEQEQQYNEDEQSAAASITFRVLEVAAGSGVHTVYFSRKLIENAVIPFVYYATDPEASSLASIQAHMEDDKEEHPSQSVREYGTKDPLKLTLTAEGILEQDEIATALSNDKMDLIININMIHISPWSATIGLMKAARTYLKVGGILYLYGPYRVQGTCVESNLKFEQWLKLKDTNYGVRNLEDVIEVAKEQGLEFVEKIEMPANNLSVLFRKI